MSWYFALCLVVLVVCAVSDLEQSQHPWWRWLMWGLLLAIVCGGSILEQLVAHKYV